MNLKIVKPEDFNLVPFPHMIIDGALSKKEVQAINDEWPKGGWHDEMGSFQIKRSTTNLPPAAKKVMENFDVEFLEYVTGIPGLFMDPENFGGGLHSIPSGGFLNMHCDFQMHPHHDDWVRRVNVLIYLNETWEPEWGGQLVLGEYGEKQIEPIGGRAVIFETSDRTWHGHPIPTSSPPHIERRSMAIYFYTRNPSMTGARKTTYRKSEKRKK